MLFLELQIGPLHFKNKIIFEQILIKKNNNYDYKGDKILSTYKAQELNFDILDF